MNFRPIIEECIDKGWEPTRITGGHLIMTKENKRSVPIPIHKHGIPDAVILKQIEQPPPSKSVPRNDIQIPAKSPQKATTKKSTTKPSSVCISYHLH